MQCHGLQVCEIWEQTLPTVCKQESLHGNGSKIIIIIYTSYNLYKLILL